MQPSADATPSLGSQRGPPKGIRLSRQQGTARDSSVVCMQQAQQQTTQQRPGQARSGFTMDDLLRNLQSQQAGRQQQQRGRSPAPTPPKYSDIGTNDGPVIDAEWTTIDEER